MGLKHHLADFASANQGADGKPTPYAIAKTAKLATNSVYKYMADPSASISWDALAKLCEALNCQPGDLLTYERD